MVRRIPLAFPLMIGVIGAILICYSAMTLYAARRAATWPTVPGMVLDSSLQPEEKIREKGQKLTFYNSDVRYAYGVNGKDYISDKVRVDLRGETQNEDAR